MSRKAFRKTPPHSTPKMPVVCTGFAVRSDSGGIFLVETEGFRGTSHSQFICYYGAYSSPLRLVPDYGPQ
jgi:hypothetical protein